MALFKKCNPWENQAMKQIACKSKTIYLQSLECQRPTFIHSMLLALNEIYFFREKKKQEQQQQQQQQHNIHTFLDKSSLLAPYGCTELYFIASRTATCFIYKPFVVWNKRHFFAVVILLLLLSQMLMLLLLLLLLLRSSVSYL